MKMTKQIKVVADNEFTDLHAQHLHQIQMAASDMLEVKYKRGQLEHGGSLWEPMGNTHSKDC